jgi:conjugal transfer mating pair stabilization protein TraN
MAPRSLRWKQILVWLTLACFTVTHVVADPASHAQGLAAGQAANPLARDAVTAPSAESHVPGYTRTPPERAYYGQPTLTGRSDELLAACALAPADPVCQALRGAQASAHTPRDAVLPYDPAVLGAERIAANPAAVLENIASFYSGCSVDQVSTPATETRICRQYSGATGQSCDSTLSVAVTRDSSCSPGSWFESQSHGLVMALQCKPDLPTSQQRMRIAGSGVATMFFDADVGAGWVFPQPVHALPGFNRWGGGGYSLWFVDNRCEDDRCTLTGLVAQNERQVCTGGGESGASCSTERPFLEVYGACPQGSVEGEQISLPPSSDQESGSQAPTTLDASRCYRPSEDSSGAFGYGPADGPSGRFWKVSSVRPVTGYRINPRYDAPIPRMQLNFVRPHTTVTERDHWDDQCPSLTAGGRCAVAATARCVEGPATRDIDGAPVTRACWRYATGLSCQFGATTDECAPLAAAGCTPSGTVCRQMNSATGVCELTENTYQCPAASTTTETARSCPADVFCVAGSCFDTRAPADADFARAMTFLEAAREAGVYLDTDRLTVFNGERSRCRDRLFTNCCGSDGAGSGMSNQSLLGVGSRLVYDVLMDSANREFVYYGMRALLMNGGFNGTFTSYGVTVAVNGTALPAGSSVLYAGESVVVAFDPWSLVIAIVMYIVMSLLSCDEEEGKLAMREGAKLCHRVGTYCSSCIRVFGSCVACITYTTNKCCFNSQLARLIQEQGRPQFGKGWGSARNPDCSGFTVAQLQQLDFARMDLSEFYASIVPTLPTTGTVQSGAVERASRCYYGEGRCP